MQFIINKSSETFETKVILFTEDDSLSSDFLKEKFKENKQQTVTLSNENDTKIFVKLNNKQEKNRKAGYALLKTLKATKQVNVCIKGTDTKSDYSFLEGLLLSTYSFNKYKSEQKQETLTIHYLGDLSETDLNDLSIIVESNHIARTLVNEPQNFLTATQYSKEIEKTAADAGFDFTYFEKEKIEALKMGGLLAVNKGSVEPPTFNILEWKPKNAKNKQPIVIVGKGVVYDTGGLSLKPTGNSMDFMKADMGGSAVVVGVLNAVAKLKLNLHVIGLIAATDNRPSLNAYAPGDVITMYSGKTVEVLNTDAEGRLTLGDALHYAKQYNPELVMDFATLTGAAARAIGPQGISTMATANQNVVNQIKNAGFTTHERIVELPLWEEYGELIKSDIADIKNIGGAYAGMITAGKFLEHFVDYPWVHFDIAGSAYTKAESNYKGKGGTGVGVRLIVEFLKNY